MKTTRREFIRRVGVALGSLISAHWACCYAPVEVPQTPPTTPTIPPTRYESIQVTCYEPAGPTESGLTSQHWIDLRECWFELDNPQLLSAEETSFSSNLRTQHTDALSELVIGGEVDELVAIEIDAAFQEAVSHIQRQQATCYIALPPVFAPREDLMKQAEILEEMAAAGDIDPETLAQAQAALERDIAWLAQFHAGEEPGELDEIEITPEAAEAARILVELLLGDQGFGGS